MRGSPSSSTSKCRFGELPASPNPKKKSVYNFQAVLVHLSTRAISIEHTDRTFALLKASNPRLALLARPRKQMARISTINFVVSVLAS